MKSLKFAVLIMAAFVAGKPADKGYNVGDHATDFKLKNIDGRFVSLADFKDSKGYILIFDCNTCPYSKAYTKRIMALSKKYAPLKFPVLAINSNDSSISPGDSFAEMIKQAKLKGYDFPYLVDEEQIVARTYGATNTPHVFVLTKDSDYLMVAYIGTIDDNARNESGVTKRYVEDAVDALLAGKSVAITKTRAVGCGIKWKD